MYFKILPNFFILFFVFLYIHSDIHINGNPLRFVYSDDYNGKRFCGPELTYSVKNHCSNYKIYLEKTIGKEATAKLSADMRNSSNLTHEEIKYLKGQITEFCCTHSCNTTTLDKYCLSRLNIFF